MKIECKNFEMSSEQLIKPAGMLAGVVQAFRPVITKSRVACADVTFHVEPADYNQMTFEQKGRYFDHILTEVKEEEAKKKAAKVPNLAPDGCFNKSGDDVVVPAKVKNAGRGRYVKAVDITNHVVELLAGVNVTDVSNRLGVPRSTFVNWYKRKRIPAKHVNNLIKVTKLSLYVENGFLKAKG